MLPRGAASPRAVQPELHDVVAGDAENGPGHRRRLAEPCMAEPCTTRRGTARHACPTCYDRGMVRPASHLLVAALAAACSGEPGIEGGRTNVLLIVIDTLRADHVGAYGYPFETSPNFDRLASEGVQLDWFFSTSSWTRPGMATLFTGEYPRTVGIYMEAFDALPPEALTLAERLSERGYRTIGITANPNLNEDFGFAQGFDEHLDAGFAWAWMKPEVDDSRELEDKLDGAREITDRALAAVDRGTGEPFYMRIVYIDPHGPNAPPPAHLAVVKDSPTPNYDGEVRYADAEIGRLLDGLAERGLLEDTLVIVTSDHGEGLSSHPEVPKSEGHGTTLYDSTTHIPLVLRHPALPSGRRVEQLASSIHLVPTLLDLLGWPAGEGEFPGRSLAPLIRGEVEQLELPAGVFSETEWRRYSKVSVRTATHRLIRNDDCAMFQREGTFKGPGISENQRKAFTLVPGVELYRTPGPESPTRNRAEVDRETASDLASLLLAWEEATPRAAPLGRAEDSVLTLGDGRVVPLGRGEVDLDPETIERLRALGYLE